MRSLKKVTALACLLLFTSACSPSGDSQKTIEPLLPGLEYRSGLGFSPEKATAGLDDTLIVVEEIFLTSKNLTSINFDTISSNSAKVAAVPEGDLVVSYGDMVPVVAVSSDSNSFNASAYGGDGVCFFLEIKASESNSSINYRKGADFSVTCNPLDYTEDVVWSSDESWPSADSVVMPVSEAPIEQGVPLN
jgi:hypothetical protein